MNIPYDILWIESQNYGKLRGHPLLREHHFEAGKIRKCDNPRISKDCESFVYFDFGQFDVTEK